MHIFLVLLVYAGVTVNGSILDVTCDQNDPYLHLMQQGECACGLNPLTAKLFSLNFHPLEVVTR